MKTCSHPKSAVYYETLKHMKYMGRIVFRPKTFSVGSTSGVMPFNRAEHMRSLHASGRYTGTSRIGEWNISDDKRQRMSGLRSSNALNKSSKGYGSEYHMRVSNRELLHNKFQGESGYLYFLDFPDSIKVGFSKNWERRTTKQILGGTTVMIVSEIGRAHV